MKETALALCMLLLLVMGMIQNVRLTTANPVPYPDEPSQELPTLTVKDPQNNSDYYSSNTFKLDLTVVESESWNSYYMGFMPYIGSVGLELFLDGKPESDMPNLQLQISYSSNNLVTYYTAILSNLTDTEHVLNIVVIAEAYYEAQYTRGNEIIFTGNSNNTYITQAVNFQLNPSTKTVSFQKSPIAISRDPYPNPPILMPVIISPQNTSYTAANETQFALPLDFSINGTTSWIGYSLDNQTRVTIRGNSTLSNLEVGSHNITLFASDVFGNIGVSNPTYFSIAEQVVVPTASPFPASLVFVSTVGIVVVVSGLLAYFKKRKP